MAKAYLEKLSELINRATAGKFKNVDLECKHFFSGAAVYANGKICITLTPAGFAVKLPEQSRNSLIRDHGTKLLRYFPNGPVKIDYVVLSEAMLKDMRTLRHWVEVSIEYVTRPPTTGSVSN